MTRVHPQPIHNDPEMNAKIAEVLLTWLEKRCGERPVGCIVVPMLSDGFQLNYFGSMPATADDVVDLICWVASEALGAREVIDEGWSGGPAR